MVLKGMPVLHARTFNIDFRSELLIRPRLFFDEDAEYGFKIATDSTFFRELAPKEGRNVVYRKGKFIVIGKTAVFSDLYNVCARMPKYDHVDHETGRLAYGFIGMAFLADSVKEPFIISDSTLLDIYEMVISRRWNENYGDKGVLESVPSDFVEIEADTIKNTISYLDAGINGRLPKIVLEDDRDSREGIICDVMKRAIRGEDISLCTSLYTEKAICESCFDIVTCKNADSIDFHDLTSPNDHETRSDKSDAGSMEKTSSSSELDRLLQKNKASKLDNEDIYLKHKEPQEIESQSSKYLKKKKADFEDGRTSNRELSLDGLLQKNSVPTDEIKGRFTLLVRGKN